MNLIEISVAIRDSANKFARRKVASIMESGKPVQLLELLEEAYIRGADEALTRHVGKGKLPGEIKA